MEAAVSEGREIVQLDETTSEFQYRMLCLQIANSAQEIERDMDVVPKDCDRTPRQWIAELMPVCQSRVSFTKSDRPARR